MSFGFARICSRSLLLRRVLAEQREAALRRVLGSADPAERVEVPECGLAVRRALVGRFRAPADDTFCELAAFATARRWRYPSAKTAATFWPYAP